MLFQEISGYSCSVDVDMDGVLPTPPPLHMRSQDKSYSETSLGTFKVWRAIRSGKLVEKVRFA